MLKPNFALSLSFDGIRLLHRATGGWILVGEAALDVPDLTGALAAIRAKAMALEPSGMRTKLLIPNDQIKYIALDTTRAEQDDILSALHGATPYAVEDLAHTHVKGGGRTYIAAVAKETLAEAETFAIEHKMAPVSFVAVPEPFTFVGEPFFGKALVVGDENVPMDSDAVVVIAAPATSPFSTPSIDTPRAKSAVEPPDEDAPAPFSSGRTAPPEEEKPEPETPEPEVEAEAELSFSSTYRGNSDATISSPRADTPDDLPPAPSVAGAASLTAEPAFRSKQSSEPARQEPNLRRDPPALAVPQPEESAALPAPSLSGFARETEAAAPVVTPELRAVAPDPVAENAAPVIAPETAEAPAETSAILAEAVAPTPAPKSRGMFQSRRKHGANPAAEVPVNEAAEASNRMTVFGARKSPRPTPVGGKPKYLGLILTLILLLLLAAVAAWASMSEDGFARWFGPRETEIAGSVAIPVAIPVPVEETEITEIIDESAADLADVIDETDVRSVAIAPEIDTPSLALTPPPGQVLSPDEAQRLYAATGVWQRAPRVPTRPRSEIIGTLYTGAIDPNIDGHDAIALPRASAALTDVAFGAPKPPAPFGTVFPRDARGFILATPEGTILPSGVLIFAGSPPIKPPVRSAPIVASAPVIEDDPGTVDDPENGAIALTTLTPPISRPNILAPNGAALAGFRPQARPSDLAENAERNTLGGLTRNELAAFRPRLRPAGLAPAIVEPPEIVEVPEDLLQEAIAQITSPETLASASTLAIATSRRPDTRPRNFARVVARAQRNSANQASASNNETTGTAPTAPRTVAPTGPVSTTVARAATQENAINLRQVNLIGVYGQPSSRQALVRLGNGRYVRVSVGDRLDGGRISTIGESDLSYVKRGRTIVLEIPS